MFVIKQNDTLPSLEVQLLDYANNPMNLELCGVAFHMSDLRELEKINRPAEISDLANGNVIVNWLNGDTSKAGFYKCEFEINMPDGKILTFPNDGHFLINIVRDLA